jgi:hypothetical protein
MLFSLKHLISLLSALWAYNCIPTEFCLMSTRSNYQQNWLKLHTEELPSCKNLKNVYVFVQWEHPHMGMACPLREMPGVDVVLSWSMETVASLADAVTLHCTDSLPVQTFDTLRSSFSQRSVQIENGINETSLGNMAWLALHRKNIEERAIFMRLYVDTSTYLIEKSNR